MPDIEYICADQHTRCEPNPGTAVSVYVGKVICRRFFESLTELDFKQLVFDTVNSSRNPLSTP